MLGYLSDILQGLEDLPSLIVSAGDKVLNGLFAALAAFITELFNVLPSMPNLPTFTGDWIGWMNWLAPVGEIVDAIGSLIVMYLGYLAIRYSLQLIRAAD